MEKPTVVCPIWLNSVRAQFALSKYLPLLISFSMTILSPHSRRLVNSFIRSERKDCFGSELLFSVFHFETAPGRVPAYFPATHGPRQRGRCLGSRPTQAPS